METLASNIYFKIKICLMLGELSSRKYEHNMEQNKLSFLISDLFELLLKDNDEALRKLSLRIFQQFSYDKQYIIVNNVSRMLPNMDLEQYLLHTSDKIISDDYFKVSDMKSMKHKCLGGKINSISATNVSEWKNSGSMENPNGSLNSRTLSRDTSFEKRSESSNFIIKPSVEIKRSISFNNIDLPQNKRFRLSENVDEDDDTIGEVIQRIKSEIKCLKKVLCKDKPSAKNAQDIKILACQIQTLLD